jgi:glycine/D-amino acid oxidase-like deaminating enzyme
VSKCADVVVIGGGVIGTAVSYYLAKSGLDVCSIEKRGITDGTSSRCDGHIAVYDSVPGHHCKLSKKSLEFFPGLSDELGYDISWSQDGTLLLAESEDEYEIVKSHCALMVEKENLPYRILDQQEIQDSEPHVAKDVVGGLNVACDGTLNPMALGQGFSYAAQRLGARVLSYTSVTDIKLDSRGQVEKVITDRGEIYTPRVVNTAGVWASEIGKMVGLDIPIKPRQGHIIVGQRTFPVTKRPVCEFGYIMAKLETGGYTRQVTPEMEEFGIALVLEPTEAGNFIFGSSRRFVGMDITSDSKVLKEMARRAIRFFPVLGELNAIRSYVGCRPWTPDHNPIISKTEIPGFYIAAGHEGNGIGMSAMTGKLLSEIICDVPTTMPVESFRWDRFLTDNSGKMAE